MRIATTMAGQQPVQTGVPQTAEAGSIMELLTVGVAHLENMALAPELTPAAMEIATQTEAAAADIIQGHEVVTLPPG